MQARQLLIIALLAIAAIGSALYLTRDRGAADTDAEALFAGLEDRLNAITGMRVVDAEGNTVVTLDRTDTDWVIREKDGYPADRALLRETLLELANSRVVERKTAKPEFYGRLGIEDPGSPDAASTALEIDVGDDSLRLIVGKIAFDGYGTYVRLSGDPQGLLVSGELEPSTDALDWVPRELTNIPATDIAAVTITQADGEQLRIEKSARTDAGFTVLDVPEGRELTSEFVANGIGSALTTLNLDDVSARHAPDPASETTARFELFDGRIVEVRTYDHDEQTWATFDFGHDAELAARFAAADTEETDGDQAAAENDDAEDTESEITRLSEKLGGWSYLLPEYKSGQIRQRMSDLLKAPETEEDAG
jgi:hypothetical protein